VKVDNLGVVASRLVVRAQDLEDSSEEFRCMAALSNLELEAGQR
jgi:hypothetical protein